LSKKFGSFAAVDDLTLGVSQGELFCFLGPNGAGKTTTIKVLTGLLKPSSGEVRIDGKDIVNQPKEAKKIIGYVPDMPFLYDRLTPEEFLEFIGDLYDIPAEIQKERRNRLLMQLGLNDYKGNLVKDFSHGMRQRLIYAATFLHEPKCMFVDEPLIGLDPYTIRLLKGMLRKYVADGMTIFLTTHILALAEEIADRIGVIHEGKLIALGTLQELQDDWGGENLEDVFLEMTKVRKQKA
jgi:ABC-2 type transport system ATP-binding protein